MAANSELGVPFYGATILMLQEMCTWGTGGVLVGWDPIGDSLWSVQVLAELGQPVVYVNVMVHIQCLQVLDFSTFNIFIHTSRRLWELCTLQSWICSRLAFPHSFCHCVVGSTKDQSLC